MAGTVNRPSSAAALTSSYSTLLHSCPLSQLRLGSQELHSFYNGKTSATASIFDPITHNGLVARAGKHVRTVLAFNLGNGSRHERSSEMLLAAACPALLLPLDASPCQAATAEDITNALLKVQDATQKLTVTVGSAYETSNIFFEQLFNAVKPTVDAVTPYVKGATDTTFQVAAPIASDVAIQVEKALQGAGLDTKPMVDAAKTAVVITEQAAKQTSNVIEAAKPVASSTWELIISADPLFLAGGAGAFILLYLLSPSIFSSIAYAVRGYKGDLTAAQVLDVLSKSDYTLIDIRSDKDKLKSGLPSLPRNAKSKYVSIPIEELPGKIKGQLRNPRKVAAEVAALKISYLKKIGRGSNIVVLDTYGDAAKIVAKLLSQLGFNHTWVVFDGFDGSKGWVQSRIGTDSFGVGSSSIAEVLSPARIIPARTTELLKTSSEVVDVAPKFRRLLPGGYDK